MNGCVDGCMNTPFCLFKGRAAALTLVFLCHLDDQALILSSVHSNYFFLLLLIWNRFTNNLSAKTVCFIRRFIQYIFRFSLNFLQQFMLTNNCKMNILDIAAR